jgi:hypothetical protein
MSKVPPFDDLILTAKTSAIHLEMRDSYTPSDPDFLAWRAGTAIDVLLANDGHQWWQNLVRTNVARVSDNGSLTLVQRTKGSAAACRAASGSSSRCQLDRAGAVRCGWLARGEDKPDRIGQDGAQ